jgi:hypothetical protein
MEKDQPTDYFCQLGQTPPSIVYHTKPSGVLGAFDFLNQTGSSLGPFENRAFTLVRELGGQVEKLQKEFEELKKMMAKLLERPNIVPSKIYGLPSDDYHLNQPVDVVIQIHVDEVIAVFPELELYGEGENEMEAIEDLKHELLDLYDDLNGMADETLGDKPKEWKRILKVLINRCE